jgi:protein-disulfide isomerase
MLGGALPLAVACGGVATTPAAPRAPSPAAAPPAASAAPTPVEGDGARGSNRVDETDPVFKIPVGKSPVRGGATAPVTIVEFADYQCPYCERAEETLRELRARHGDEIRLVFKDEPLPFHSRAEPAAEAALEVRTEKGDGAFWTMHDLLLENQSDLGDETLVRLGVKAGARADLVRTAIAKHTHRAEIEDDLDVAEDFEAGGTPHFFVNGRRLVGAQPPEAFEAVIGEELQKARKLVDAGTRPEAVYDALIAQGQGPPEPAKVDVAHLPANDPSRGPATARVTVHEFADFQCPYCAQAEATLGDVAKSYGDAVRFVWHDLPLPFHRHALAAATGAREARTQRGDKAFWTMHDRLLSNPARLSRDDLDADARALGLDMTKWKASLESDAHASEIDADRAAAEALGFQGTPSFVVVASGTSWGYAVVGAQDFVRFHKLIVRALAEAPAGGPASVAKPEPPGPR